MPLVNVDDGKEREREGTNSTSVSAPLRQRIAAGQTILEVNGTRNSKEMTAAISSSANFTMVISREACTVEQFLRTSLSWRRRVKKDRLQELARLGIFLLDGKLETVEIRTPPV